MLVWPEIENMRHEPSKFTLGPSLAGNANDTERKIHETPDGPGS